MASAAPKKISFNRDVRAILSENCYTCHGPDAAARKAKLRLDKREAAVAENKDGLFAIKPGDVEDSELIYRIFAKDADELMPPKESKLALTAEQKAILKQWVAEGAEYEPHWAYEKPKREAVPVVKNSQWSRNDVDRFILAQLEKRGWKPSKVADKQALIRRVSLDSSWPATDPGGGGGVCGGYLAGRLRKASGSFAGQAGVWRALGAAMAGPCAVR